MKLTIVNGADESRRFELEDGELYDLGRGSQTTIRLRDSFVSRVHARLSVYAGEAMVHDWGSSSGITVNGDKVTDAILNNGDIVKMGNTELQYEE